MSLLSARLSIPDDAAQVAAIYNQGIEDRTATFETTLRTPEDVLSWFDGAHPIVVVEAEGGPVVGFARASEYRPRACYRGVFEFGVYVDRAWRRRGVGALALGELVVRARETGAWKLVSRIFADNEASRVLVQSRGFREVGVYHRHAKLDGRWRDVVIVEKFLAPLGAEGSIGPPLGRASREQILSALTSDDPTARKDALTAARSLLEVYRRDDRELLAAAADGFFWPKSSDPAARAGFVELLRSYAAIAPGGRGDVYEALWSRLERRDVDRDRDAFYEANFVIRQLAFASDASRSELAPHLPRLLAFLEATVAAPQIAKTRVSAGNLVSLLLTLALAACDSDDDKAALGAIAAQVQARHGVPPPATLRPPPKARTEPPPLPRPPALPAASQSQPIELTEDDFVTVEKPRTAKKKTKRSKAKGEQKQEKPARSRRGR